jgi:hypothetical protein
MSPNSPRITDLRHAVAAAEPAQPKTPASSSNTASAGDSTADEKSGTAPAGQSASTAAPLPASSIRTGRPYARLNQEDYLGTITLAQEPYVLFCRPISIRLGNDPVLAAIEQNLVICGLRSQDSMQSEARSVPYSTLIWSGLAAMTLFGLSWPLFKLRYMSNTERFSPRDGWYLILAIFLASTSTMFMLLNGSYTSGVQERIDTRLERVARRMQRNVKREVDATFLQMKLMNAGMERSKFAGRMPIFVPNYFSPSRDNAPLVNPVTCYPYFEIAFWANREGQQLLKFDARPVTTPPIPLDKFPFFEASLADLKWQSTTAPKAGPEDTLGTPDCKSPPDVLSTDNLHIDPQYSPNTGEFLVILAAPLDQDGRASERSKNKAGSGQDETWTVYGLAARPLSLVEPLLPPGYLFAVVDRNCNVLFHSDVSRNLRENFCRESRDRTELPPTIFSGSSIPLDTTYLGQPERAFITSLSLPALSIGPAYLVVFREPGLDLTINLAIILVCILLMGAYFLVLPLAAVLHLALRRPLHWVYAPRFIWPNAELGFAYLQLFVANGLILLLYWLTYRRMFEAPLLTLTLAVAVASAGMAMLKLGRSNLALRRAGDGLTLVVLLGCAGVWGRFWLLRDPAFLRARRFRPDRSRLV